MPTFEQRLAFFNAHVDAVHGIIEKANVKRAMEGFSPLTEPEVDAGLDEMINMNKKGENFQKFQFPEPPPESKQVRTPPPQPMKADQSIQGERFQFDIIKVNNGFLMNMNRAGEAETFVFKQIEELIQIFSKILFDSERVTFVEQGTGNVSIVSVSGLTEFKKGEPKPHGRQKRSAVA